MKFMTLIAVVVTVSGCSALPIPASGNSGNGGGERQMIQGKGLVVTDFSVSDNTLSPGQKADVTLKMKNYHRKPISVNVSLYNLGLLSKSGKSCTPSEMREARKGVYPVMRCSWTIAAPPEEMVGGFEQRKTAVTANIQYNSVLKNFKPFKVQFKPRSQIDSTSKKVMKFSNGEVRVRVRTETPVALGQNKTVHFLVRKAGSGRIKGDYSFDYRPDSIFVAASEYGDSSKADVEGECVKSDSPVLRNRLDFSCYIRSDATGSVVRNLFFTVSYKYVQAPSVDVTIVK